MGRPARKRLRGHRWDEPFIGLPRSALESPLFSRLTPYAIKLLIDVAAQFRGDNNGDLCIAWKLMKPRGWRSEETLHRAKCELIEAGFLFEARKGRRPNVCSLFALTWHTLDHNDKHDPGARGGYRRHDYLHRDGSMAPATVHSIARPTSLAVVAKAA